MREGIEAVRRGAHRFAAEAPFVLESWVFSRPLRPLLAACPALLLATGVLSIVLYQSIGSNQDLVTRYQWALDRASDAEDWKKAEVCGLKLEQLGSMSDTSRFAMAQAAMDRGEHEVAEQLFHQLAPDNRSGYPPAHFWVARELLRGKRQWKLKESDLLVHHLEKSMSATGEEQRETAGVLLANLYAARNELGKAVRCLRPLVSRRPELQVRLAELYAAMGDDRRCRNELEEAEPYLRQQMEGQPENVRLRLLLAKTLTLTGRFTATEALLLDGLSRVDDPRLRTVLSRLYVVMSDQLEQDDDSQLSARLELLQKSLRYEPRNSEALGRLASIVGHSHEQTAIVRAAVEEVLADGLAPTAVHMILGTIAALDGNMEEARRHLEEAHQMQSDVPILLNNLAWVLAHEDPPQLAQALLLVNQAVELATDHPQIRETRGQILVQLKRWKEALTDLEYALHYLRNRRRLHEALAEAYDQLGDDDLSKLHRKRFEQLAELEAFAED